MLGDGYRNAVLLAGCDDPPHLIHRDGGRLGGEHVQAARGGGFDVLRLAAVLAEQDRRVE
jgi:hypothetical protein